MNNRIGIMQGRLSAPRGGRLQSFPWETWEGEFAKARDCGLGGIEWIFEEPSDENPLLQPEGRRRIQMLVRATGIRIPCVCADYFMEHPLVRVEGSELDRRVAVLRQVIAGCSELSIPILDIPFVDASAINDSAEIEQVASVIAVVANDALHAGVTLGLETNLPPASFVALLRHISHPAVGVTYDIGNSASLGFDPRAELDCIGGSIVNVHVKDRVRNGGTVCLGRGAADLPFTLGRLRAAGYAGPLILQVARDGDEVEHARRNVSYVRGLMDAEGVGA